MNIHLWISAAPKKTWWIWCLWDAIEICKQCAINSTIINLSDWNIHHALLGTMKNGYQQQSPWWNRNKCSYRRTIVLKNNRVFSVKKMHFLRTKICIVECWSLMLIEKDDQNFISHWIFHSTCFLLANSSRRTRRMTTRTEHVAESIINLPNVTSDILKVCNQGMKFSVVSSMRNVHGDREREIWRKW